MIESGSGLPFSCPSPLRSGPLPTSERRTLRPSVFEMYFVWATCGIRAILCCTALPCFLVASGVRKTRSASCDLTFSFVVEDALMTGTKTPISSVVRTTVTIAARLGAALRRRARKASARKKKMRLIVASYDRVWPGSDPSGSPFVCPSLPTPISARMRTANSVVDSSW